MLGEKVREQLTGFTGTATARCEHITGCVEVLVVANELGEDGKPIEAWFDESRLIVSEVIEQPEETKPEETKPAGGPRDSKPPPRSRPTMQTSYKTYDGPKRPT